MAAAGQARHADAGGSQEDPGGGKAEGVPAGGVGRIHRRAIAGALSAGGLAAASLSLALVLAVPGGTAGANGTQAKTVKVSTAKIAGVGTVLTTSSGLTLYRFTEDSPGTSMCTGACAKIWPPLFAPKGARVSGPHGVKGLSLIRVANGHWQVAFHRLPLYRFEGDKKKGQAHGQDVAKAWFAVLKSGIPATATAGAATTTTAPAVSTTQPTTSTRSGTGSGSSSNASTGSNAGTGANVTRPTPAPTPATQPTQPTQPPPTTTPTTTPPPPPTTPTTTPPPPPTTTTTTSVGSGGVGF